MTINNAGLIGEIFTGAKSTNEITNTGTIGAIITGFGNSSNVTNNGNIYLNGGNGTTVLNGVTLPKGTVNNSYNIEKLNTSAILMPFFIDPLKLAQDTIRGTWIIFANEILNKKMGYEFAAAGMINAMQAKPKDMNISGDNYIIDMVKAELKSLELQRIAIANASGMDTIDYISKDFIFNTGDLKYMLHQLSGGLSINGTKNSSDTWNLNVAIKDTYDFTEMVDFMSQKTTENKIGFAGNNLLTLSQNVGALVPYNITIKYSETIR